MMVNVVLIVVFVLMSAFFSGTETAISSSNRLRIKQRVEERGSFPSKAALFAKDNYEEALSTVLICNNLVTPV